MLVLGLRKSVVGVGSCKVLSAGRGGALAPEEPRLQPRMLGEHWKLHLCSTGAEEEHGQVYFKATHRLL